MKREAVAQASIKNFNKESSTRNKQNFSLGRRFDCKHVHYSSVRLITWTSANIASKQKKSHIVPKPLKQVLTSFSFYTCTHTLEIVYVAVRQPGTSRTFAPPQREQLHQKVVLPTFQSSYSLLLPPASNDLFLVLTILLPYLATSR